MIRETNWYTEQHIQRQKLIKRLKILLWKPSTNEEMLKFLGIIIEMGLVQMLEIEYDCHKSKLFRSDVSENTMSWDRFEFFVQVSIWCM